MKSIYAGIAAAALVGGLAVAYATHADTAPPVPDAANVRFQWGVKIPMRDGVRLHATVYLPKQSQSPAPCLFTLTPYIAQTHHDRGVYFAARGYPFLTVDVRGRDNSEGEFQPLIQEAHDGYDIVEWLAGQPYCDGKVSMWGGSYSGYNQWATAKEFPPHLATIVPVAAPYIGVDFPARNNIFTPYDVQWLTFTGGRTGQDRIFADGSFWTSQYRQWYEAGRALSEFDTLLGNPSDIFKEWLAHPHPDAYWDRYNPSAEQYAKLQLPILTITGSHDANQPGALLHYREHMKHASAAARASHYLVIGPWDHAGTRTPKAEFGGLTLGPASLVDLPRLHLDWYRWTMQGGPKPEFLQKNVAYYVMGAERWRYAGTLDAVTAQRRPYFISSKNGAADVLASGSLGPTPEGGPDRYLYDPRDRSVAEIESVPAPELTDQRLIYARSGKQLVYHTEPFEQATEVSGFFKFSAWIAIDRPDTDFAVSIYEIRADGSSIFMAGDMLRARYRESFRDPKLIRTRGPLRYDFDRFTFVSRQIRAGSRLRLAVAPVDSIYWQKNYNSGGDVANETIANARAVTATLYHDRAHPSALYVPIGQPEVSSDALVGWARERAVALQEFPSDEASTRAVRELVAPARVVALGEPAHGAHEPLAFRNRLFKYLVEELGFTAIALESGVSESRRVNDFVRGAPGEARDIARAGLTWGFGDYPENVELLQWMRTFNAAADELRKVSFYGIDLSGSSDGDFTTARVALDDALAYLARVAPEASRDARSALEPFLQRFSRGKYQALEPQDKQHLRKAIKELIAVFERERPRLVAVSSEKDFEWARRSAVAASQVERLFRLWPADTPAQGVAAEFDRAAAARDAAMAENVRWALQREGAPGRLLVYAHNAHIMNGVLRGGIWSVYPEPPAMMGRHLRSALGKDLVIIGVSAAENGPGLPAAPTSQESVEVALGRLGLPTLLLDMRGAAEFSAVASWLGQLQSMRANYTTQMVVPLGEAFDALVFIDRLNAASNSTRH